MSAPRHQIYAHVYGKQAEFLSATKFIKGFVAGRGAGKSHIGAVNVMMDAKDGQSWMGVSPDSGVIADTTWPTFEAAAKYYRKWIRGVKSPYPKIWFKTQGGGIADITLRSGEKPDKLRGPNKAGLWLDEASVMREEVFDVAIACLRWKRTMGQVFMTFTPRGKHHWTFSKFFKPIDDYELDQIPADQVVMIGGQAYQYQPNAHLVAAKSAENPFLPPEYVETIRSQYTLEFARQELEGEFVDIAGLLFNRPDFEFLDRQEIQYNAMRVRYWDMAATEGGGSYTVGVLMALYPDGRYVIENVVRGQYSPRQRRQAMELVAKTDAERFDNTVLIVIEQEGGSGGKEIMSQQIRNLAGFPVFRDIVSGKKFRKQDGLFLPGSAKVVRAGGFAAMVEQQNVFLVRAKWNQAYLDELIAFPMSTVCDQVDASSGAFNWLARRGSLDTATEMHKIDDIYSKAAAQLLALAKRQSRDGRNVAHEMPRSRFAERNR